jgi:LPS O-antigen subunit length determinant protein (WzzB/FepE family)
MENSDKNLIEFFKILYHGRAIVLWTLVFSLLFAAAFVLLSPKIYRSQILMELARFDSNYLEQPDTIRRLIELKFAPIKVAVRGTQLEASVEARSPQKAKSRAQELVDFITKHQQKLSKESNLLIDTQAQQNQARIQKTAIHIQRTQEKLAQIETLIKSSQSLLESAKTDPKLEPVLTKILENQLAAFKLERSILQNNLKSLKENLENLTKIPAFKVQEPKLILEPTLEPQPIRPQILSTLGSAAILGFAAGILLVLIQAWWQRNKKLLLK